MNFASTFFTVSALSLVVSNVFAGNINAEKMEYDNNPITVQNYTGKKTDSTSYTGQIARHALHNSLKKLTGKSTGDNSEAIKAKMMTYFATKDKGRAILDPKSKGAFKVKQTQIDQLSKGKNLKGKTYSDIINAWPGQMTGDEMVEFMINKSSKTEGGYDPLTGYDYKQLISKFLMGAVFYNQAVDNYLDEKLEANTAPNNKPYKKGTPYTGKEHIWDEAFGYFGVPAHTMKLTAKQVYNIAKQKDFKAADYNKDGVVDLKTEMAYAHGYYAAGLDKGGKTNYMHTITQAFIDGRQLITSAKGNALSDAQRSQLKAYAKTIKINWQQVIAETAFKYVGSTYKDIQKLQIIIESNGDAKKAFRTYAKHWAEMKGFLMALQSSGKSLGKTGVKINRLVGYGPVLFGGSQVTGIDAEGNYATGGSKSMGDYMIDLIKLQKLLAAEFKLKALPNNVTGQMDELIRITGESKSAEND